MFQKPPLLNFRLAKVLTLVGLLFVLVTFFTAVISYTRGGTQSRVYAATSSNINYQARLLDKNGNKVADGDYNIEFKLYDGGNPLGTVGLPGAAGAGTNVWTETRSGASTVRVVNGYFSVSLGEVTPFGAIEWDQDHWLTMNVGGTGPPTWDGEMTPRLKLTAVPYAFQSKRAELLNQTQGAHTGILDFLTLTADRSISLPDKDGTLCIAGSEDCVDVATTGTTALTASNSGLEISTDGLRLLGGCSDGQMIRWNGDDELWECSSGSGSSFTTRFSDGSVSTTVSGGLEFGPATGSNSDFALSGVGGGFTRIQLSEAVSFNTSVTTPLLTNDGGLTMQTTATAGADDIIFQTAGTEKLRLLENGSLLFEKGSNDVTFAINTPSGSAATYTFDGGSGTVLTTANFSAAGLDTAYVNAAESPAAGDISGSFTSGLTIGSNSVALGTDTAGDYIASIGTVSGLTVTGGTGENSSLGLSVNYGSTSSTSVRGDTSLTCPSGTGNLTGGGGSITLGSGGSCGSISTNAAVSFSTSVTTPLVTNAGGLTMQTTATGGADDIIFQTAGTEKLRLLENGSLLFEKGTNDATIAVNTPTGSAATYTFDGASGTILTTANFGSGGGLDSTYVNTNESPAAGDISGSFTSGLTIGSNSVALGTDTVGDYIASIGIVTGLTVTGGTGENSTLGLGVNYGSTSTTAVRGDTALTCASGSGNLTGGGGSITLGSGGSCGSISTNAAVSFGTSVTTPILTNAGALSVQTTGGANSLSLTSGSGLINIGASTLATTGSLGLDMVNAATTTFTISNSGAGVANLSLSNGNLIVGGTQVLSNARVLGGLTGLTVASGGANITGGATVAGGLSTNNDGISNAGAVSGVTTLSAMSATFAQTTNAANLTMTNNARTSGALVSLTQSTSAFTGTGLVMNMASGSGSFASGSFMDLQLNGTSRFTVDNTGALTISSNSANGLRVRSTGGVDYFNVDVAGNAVRIGNPTDDGTGVLFVLDSKNTAGDPATGINGGSYYNSVDKKSRCYEDSIWKDCIVSTATPKLTSQTITNSAAFTNDAHIFFPMDANAVYTFTASINFSSTSATGDFKYTFTVPTGAAVYIQTAAPTSATASTTCNISASGQTCTLAVTANYRGTMDITGFVDTAATAGNLQFQFAQNTATAAQSVTVYAGSSINWKRTLP
jgi:hypothetical protein